MDYFSSNFTIGILGGGQLGKMLLNETRKYDIRTKVLDSSSESPCRIATDSFEIGDLLDYETVYNFGKEASLLTIEIEKVNLDALEALEKEGKLVYPPSKTLRRIQNKGVQKQYYLNQNIPTAPFNRYAYFSDFKSAIEKKLVALPLVWKCAKFGYDGQGVKIVRDIKDLKGLPEVECVAENYIPFKKELSVIVARSVSGEIKTYPIVEMKFHPKANQVEYVICPAQVPKEIEEKAKQLAIKTVQVFEHVGLLAVEMFQTEEDEILVNEIAPRPHNSGHWSIEASITNQFEQHLRAILDLPLGSTESKIAAVMVNLVGAEGYAGKVLYKNIYKIFKMKGVTPHIYGKKQTHPYRKMGHLTIVHKDVYTAMNIAEKVKATIKVISKSNE